MYEVPICAKAFKGTNLIVPTTSSKCRWTFEISTFFVLIQQFIWMRTVSTYKFTNKTYPKREFSWAAGTGWSVNGIRYFLSSSFQCFVHSHFVRIMLRETSGSLKNIFIWSSVNNMSSTLRKNQSFLFKSSKSYLDFRAWALRSRCWIVFGSVRILVIFVPIVSVWIDRITVNVSKKREKIKFFLGHLYFY